LSYGWDLVQRRLHSADRFARQPGSSVVVGEPVQVSDAVGVDSAAGDRRLAIDLVVRMETMGHHRKEPESSADLVQEADSALTADRTGAQPWPQPIRDGRWTDDSGTQWRVRGRGTQPPRALLRLLKRPDLRVLHAYGPHPTEVSGTQRQALLERVRRYLAGEAPPHSAFWLAEFRDDDHHVMLVIEEAC
jgi:hypothetical protein